MSDSNVVNMIIPLQRKVKPEKFEVLAKPQKTFRGLGFFDEPAVSQVHRCKYWRSVVALMWFFVDDFAFMFASVRFGICTTLDMLCT